MAKQLWKPGNMIYPLPAVMASVTDGEGNDNIITVALTGTVCTNPAMAYISVRPSRYSYDMIRKTGEFVINLTTEKLAYATDFCGCRSGRDVDKFRKLNLTKEKAQFVSAPMIGEAPVSIECRVREVKELGSHDMFLADVLAGSMRMKLIWIKTTGFVLMMRGFWFIPMGSIWRWPEGGNLRLQRKEEAAEEAAEVGLEIRQRSRDGRDGGKVEDVRKAKDVRGVEDVRKAGDVREVEDVRKARDVREIEDVRKARDVREIKDVGKGRERETVGSAEL